MIAVWPGVKLRTFTQGFSGQVQEKALIIGCGAWPGPAGPRRAPPGPTGLRRGKAANPEEDAHNELLQQKTEVCNLRARLGDLSNERSSAPPEETELLLLS